jgi:N-acetyl-gamma-glutamyl-phosphate reductase
MAMLLFLSSVKLKYIVNIFNFTNLYFLSKILLPCKGKLMKPTIFVDGDQGTTGLQILSRLSTREDLTLLTLPADIRKNPQARAEAINQCDIAILCLPDEQARAAALSVVNPAVRLIDASSAHRTDPGWTYGLPELDNVQSQLIAQSYRVTNPGCYPTGAIALLRPLIRAGLIAADYPVSIYAVSGYSGRGRIGVDEHEGANSTKSLPFQVYGLGLNHKHVPEIQMYAGLSTRPFFVPSYGSFRQGIVLTIPIHLHALSAGVNSRVLRDCLAQTYAESSQINVLDTASTEGLERLDPQTLNGTNEMNLSVFGNDKSGQVLLAAVFDNLGKGAAGAAVQNLDLMLKARAHSPTNPGPS